MHITIPFIAELAQLIEAMDKHPVGAGLLVFLVAASAWGYRLAFGSPSKPRENAPE